MIAYWNNFTRIVIRSSVSFNYPHHLCPSSSQANVMSAPFDRIQKIRFVQGATMGKGGLLRSWGKDRAKSSGLSRDPVFFSRSRRSTVCVRVRVCVDVHASFTVGVPRSTNRLSMYAWVISNGMETEAGGNKGDGEAVNIISLGIIRYYRASPLRLREEGVVESWAGNLEWNEKKYSFFQRCENNFDEFSCVLEDFIRHSTKICLPEWESSERRNVSRVEQSRHWTVGETLIWKLIS